MSLVEYIFQLTDKQTNYNQSKKGFFVLCLFSQLKTNSFYYFVLIIEDSIHFLLKEIGIK